MMLAALLFMGNAALSAPIRLCTGSDSGVYFAAGQAIKEMAGGSLSIEVKTSAGTIENMDRTLKTDAADPEACDAMIGQPDGPVLLQRQQPGAVKKLRKIAGLHREYLHVLCSKESGVDALEDLAYDPAAYRLAIGELGSGGWLIWQNIVAEDEDYATVPVTNEGGVIALSAVSTNTATCMLVPAGLRNGIVNEADATYGDTVAIVDASDGDFNDATDVEGKKLYDFADIPGDTYEQSLQAGWGGGVETISWLASVYVNTDRIAAADLASFVKAVGRAAVGIRAEFGS